MDISVIVVTYNQEDTIARTLDSILAQKTSASFEIIIGDDCSTDGTGEICREYAAKYPDRIVYLRRESNLGVVANYFDCIAKARGRLLADCAGDDFWVDDAKLQRQFEVMVSDPEVSLVATRWLCIDGNDGNISAPENPCPPGTYARRELLVPIFTQKAVIHLCTALYRRNIITRAVAAFPDIFLDNRFSCEDRQIILAMAAEGKVVVLPQVTLHYSVGHDSISHRTDFGARFDYSFRSNRQALILQHHFLASFKPAELEPVEDFNRHMIDYLAALAFRSADPFRRNRLRMFVSALHTTPAARTRLYMLLMSSLPLWKLALKIRSIRH